MKLLLLPVLALLMTSGSALAQTAPKPPKSPRIYIFDCGTIKGMDVTLYGFKDGEVQIHDFVVPCYLIVHPKGTLMWDVGTLPDSAGAPTTQGIMTVRRTLRSQLQEIGYQPEKIDYLAFSHYHTDHTANANDFAKSTWLVRQPELDIMFGPPPAEGQTAGQPRRIIQTQSFSALKDSKRKVLTANEYDVFGDKSVIIKSAPGHTPGHQVLFVKTKKDGPILIAGDLYHYPEEGPLNRFPTFEFDKAQSAISRKEIAEFVKKHKAQMWIEHDPATYEKQKKSPAFYE